MFEIIFIIGIIAFGGGLHYKVTEKVVESKLKEVKQCTNVSIKTRLTQCHKTLLRSKKTLKNF